MIDRGKKSNQEEVQLILQNLVKTKEVQTHDFTREKGDNR